MNTLIRKYNVPGPRYTSYLTVPYWNIEAFSVSDWKNQLKSTFDSLNNKEGISIYIHITQKGKPYVRNVCMAFDLHLQKKQPETRLFSMTV